MQCNLAFTPLVRVASTTTSCCPGSLGFPGNAALAALVPLIVVFTALALSFAALSIVGVWAVSSTVRPSKNTAKFSAQPSFRQGSYSLPGQPPVADVLVTRSSRSCGRWFLTHWCYPQNALGRCYLRLLADRWSHPSSYGRVALHLSPLLFSSSWSNS